jgi:hypothetical protein
MSSYRSTRADSRKRTALGDISNAGGNKKAGAKKALVATSSARPTPPVAASQKRSSFGARGHSTPHVNIDAADESDPQACAKYVNEIYASFRENEGKCIRELLLSSFCFYFFFFSSATIRLFCFDEHC